jgi:hypothetical protein
MSHDLTRGRQRQLTTHSDAAQIVAYLAGLSDATLSPKLTEILRRLEVCADLIRKYGARRQVVRMMVNRYQLENPDYSQSTAERDYVATLDVFGTKKRETRDFHIDTLMEWMFDTRRRAMADKDYKTAATVEKNFMQLLKDFFPDGDTIDYEKVYPPQIIAGFFPEDLNVPLPADWEQQLMRMIKRRSGNISAEDAQVVE